MATILVVEDNDDVRDMMAVTLQLEGHTVITAANGQEALNRLQRGLRPCLILLDLMMPVMTGWEFRAAVENDPVLKHIPIVVVSAANADSAARAAVAAVVPKPIDVERLLTVVCELCDGAAAH
jgi:CheY-like chemotaxis protein